MAARKFADNFVSIANGQAVANGNWADVSDCKQVDYGVEQLTGTITDGLLVLESADNPNQRPFFVTSLDATALGNLATQSYQVSEPKPHGRLLRWRIATAIVGGTINATINGQHG